MASPRILTADRGDAGRRLDLMLHRHLTDVSTATRTRVQRWIENGQVTVNGTPVRRAARRAALGAEDVGLDILFEDDHLLALDKPAGVVVHPTYGHTEGTLMNALLWHSHG